MPRRKRTVLWIKGVKFNVITKLLGTLYTSKAVMRSDLLRWTGILWYIRLQRPARSRKKLRLTKLRKWLIFPFALAAAFKSLKNAGKFLEMESDKIFDQTALHIHPEFNQDLHDNSAQNVRCSLALIVFLMKKTGSMKCSIYRDETAHFKKRHGRPSDWVKKFQSLGAGELSWTYEPRRCSQGYDIAQLTSGRAVCNVPLMRLRTPR